MEQSNGQDRAYYAQRAAEELELALAATDADAAEAHRKLQRAYLERASIGDRAVPLQDEIG
ncbi:MAG: hypothetical protein M3438_10645 [Pseudomonadota bacterium]|nr:hypothetical protein [Sphingomonas sp.]MDQ3479590.1 hypothetical protein [Pseudomonadota bacterium]